MRADDSTLELSPVLVSDFDGTMTRHDFFKLAVEKLLPDGTPDFWAEYRAGRITHFEALRRYFASIRVSPAEVMAVVRDMDLDPELTEAVARLQDSHWQVIVASAGCDWYIRQLLSQSHVDIVVHANPGRFESARGLVMELPVASPFFSETLGIDKAAIVRHFIWQGRKVAFAGDGFPDAEAARLVPDSLRFARGDLADVLRSEQLSFHPFDRWSEIAQMLRGARC